MESQSKPHQPTPTSRTTKQPNHQKKGGEPQPPHDHHLSHHLLLEPQVFEWRENARKRNDNEVVPPSTEKIAKKTTHTMINMKHISPFIR